MATEAIDDPRHAALVALHEAECALERGDLRDAERYCLCSVAHIRDIGPAREFPDVESMKAEA